jgi:hypothetical protein
MARATSDLTSNLKPRPQRGLPTCAGPFGGAFPIPRPTGVVNYSIENHQFQAKERLVISKAALFEVRVDCS